MKPYDVIIIGAGINGCVLAHSLHLKKQKVLVLEQDSIASGGSGAAGAFINPKISKSGPLKELIEEAYLYSLDFYTTHFPQYTTSSPLLHIAKYSDDNEKVEYFKNNTRLAIQATPEPIAKLLKDYAHSFSSVYLTNSAVLEAKDICAAMLEGIEYHNVKVEAPVYEYNLWNVSGFQAHKLVLCTGASDELFKEEYIKLRRIYGQRCEVKSSTEMKASVHHEVSVSATKKNGNIAIGASHYLNKAELPSPEDGAKALIALAEKSVKLENIEVVDVHCGMRSGSNDYLPILGSLIDSSKSLALDDKAFKGDKSALVERYPQLYMVNGVGGYGFVLAPYLAELMSEHLVNKKALPEFLDVKRFYYRWAKKRGQK